MEEQTFLNYRLIAGQKCPVKAYFKAAWCQKADLAFGNDEWISADSKFPGDQHQSYWVGMCVYGQCGAMLGT